jgi:predicted NodU family carbamoyl transferase
MLAKWHSYHLSHSAVLAYGFRGFFQSIVLGSVDSGSMVTQNIMTTEHVMAEREREI